MDYLRVPVTDEKAPKTSDFAILAARAWAPPEGAALVYNCQVALVIRVSLRLIGGGAQMNRGSRTLICPELNNSSACSPA